MNKFAILFIALLLVLSATARGGRGGSGGRGGPDQEEESEGVNQQSSAEETEGSGEESGRGGRGHGEEQEPVDVTELFAEQPEILAYYTCFSTCLSEYVDFADDELTRVTLEHLKFLLKNSDTTTTDNCGCQAEFDAIPEPKAPTEDETTEEETTEEETAQEETVEEETTEVEEGEQTGGNTIILNSP